jgi:hypothetical protein
MRSLEQMPIGQRVMLTVAILVIALILLAGIGYLSGRWDEAGAQSANQTSKYEPRLLVLEREGIEDAFRQKIISLWTVWMSDDRGQPDRAVNGAKQARKAYIQSMTEIERRERDYKQSPEQK